MVSMETDFEIDLSFEDEVVESLKRKNDINHLIKEETLRFPDHGSRKLGQE